MPARRVISCYAGPQCYRRAVVAHIYHYLLQNLRVSTTYSGLKNVCTGGKGVNNTGAYLHKEPIWVNTCTELLKMPLLAVILPSP